MPLNPENSVAENILNNVFFDLGKATLRPESKVELQHLFNYLQKNQQLKRIIIGCFNSIVITTPADNVFET